MPPLSRLALLALSLLTACDSSVSTVIDADLQKRVTAVQDCFPDQYAKVQSLLDIAATWRLNSNAPAQDPAGLSWSEQPNGTIQISYAVASCTLQMTLTFYNPTGVRQDLDLSAAASLAAAVELAADSLRTQFGVSGNFLVGAWMLSGPGITGSGALTGILGGTTNQNKLDELRTTTAVPVGGPPPIASSTVTDNGPPVCTLTFNTTSLVTDAAATQQYPIGNLNIAITSPATTVMAVVTFDGTAVAQVVVADIPGRFEFNVVTKSLSYVQ